MQHYNPTRVPRIIELYNGVPFYGNLETIDNQSEFRSSDLIVGDVVEATNGFFVIRDPETGEYSETTRQAVDRAWDPCPEEFTPRVDRSFLWDLRDFVLEEYAEYTDSILSIFEYDGIAKNFAGYEFAAGDADIQVLFERGCGITSTSHQPAHIGKVDTLEVEVMRNTVPSGVNPREYAYTMSSKRWEHIMENPKVQLYPEIALLCW